MRDSVPGPVPPDPSDPDRHPDGAGPDDPGTRLGPTPAGALAASLCVGLVLGWALRSVSRMLGVEAPQVSGLQIGALLLVAAVLAVVARATHRALQQRVAPLRAQEAVNRLVLAKTCALVGALATGGYLGHALSWVGTGSEVAAARIGLSLVAAAAGALIVALALLLERACRVRSDGEAP